ncbi:sterile alpha motif domain-containing protein 9-like [Gymnodraco acuticeps]|uniref:Sterile alpha motif domain-containing protein 9-like n=1 Tax=Gymnodraco acuticeps TaxID=8218 RepID=A0A6P8ST01_GYMAC|nr:sterile alpha motif domain-containing protein 9-like [Gymnodraco acuticeps]XP_034053506.1 sterile alpha motif domain-containing protein 9-like [Gymnodraco acuticeps]XP_034053508.1 sterile alpha motif domain-containing protein 9-like [Gymnodraco acuticeps]
MESTVEERVEKLKQLLSSEDLSQNNKSPKMQLFSFLAMLNAYDPEAYLLMSECQQILGPPDPIHGGPPFEKRMEPFIDFINISGPSEHKCSIYQVFAKTAVNELAALGLSRSATMKEFMVSLCGDQTQPHIIDSIKTLLTTRVLEEKGREKFSRLISDIQEKENFYNAVSVLKTAAYKLTGNTFFPQTISRLYYIRGGIIDYKKAEEWANTAIRRAPKNSYVADTLGQVHKNQFLRESWQPEEILRKAKVAFQAFKDVEVKADEEVSPDMVDSAGTESISVTFNNRGYFGFMQVAKIAFEKLSRFKLNHSFIQEKKMEVKAKFAFFQWYLAYSQPDMQSLEPSYFWKDVALCYEMYTTNKATESITFAGLLDSLNRGLFTSKGRRALFEEHQETVSDLEANQGSLKANYEENFDVKAAEMYILSNIILSNKMHNSPMLTPVKELQAIIDRFLDTEKRGRSPEFYLLVLLLFWSDGQSQAVQEEEDEEDEQQSTEDDFLEDTTREDEAIDDYQEAREMLREHSLDRLINFNLQQYVTLMEQAFETTRYAKYLRGRYLLPLFFLGKGSGLRKWIHKSKLDAIVEKKVHAELSDEQGERTKEKWMRIHEMWITGDVWRIQEIQDMLSLINVEPCQSPLSPQDHKMVYVLAGGKKIEAKTRVYPDDDSAPGPMLSYLGFTIQGPLVFRVRDPQMSGQ